MDSVKRTLHATRMPVEQSGLVLCERNEWRVVMNVSVAWPGQPQRGVAGITNSGGVP